MIEIKIRAYIRAERVVEEYGHFGYEQLSNSFQKIKSRFGGNRVNDTLLLLQEGKLYEVALLLL